MSIEIGNYVRTNDGLIFKIFTKTKTTYGFCGLTDSSNKKYSTYTYGKGNCIDNNIKGKIVKHSKNIIDLIEVGDFVNGNIVTDKYLFAGEMPVVETVGIKYNAYCLSEGDIREILTKEQYIQNCYTVERTKKC